ncbi:MAG TPA: hypothetical protein VFM73_07515 [Xanthomonadaceae bacterium]|nr:hypothetical protein [Xanthomonadaceae bacterium]
MTTKTMGPGAGWRWLVRGFNLGRHNPKALFGAATLVMLVALLPSLLQYGVMAVTGGADPQLGLWLAMAAMVVLAVAFPLIVAGFLRVIDAAENGRPTRALAVFDTFRAGQGRGRIVLTGLALLLVYMLLFVAVLFLAGGEIAAWYWDVMQLAQASDPGATPELPPMPAGMGRLMALMLLVMMICAGLYAIGFGQVALNGRSVGEALADAFAGTLKNVLPLLVLTLLGVVAMLLAILVIGLLVGLLAVVGSIVDPIVGIVLAVPLYLGFLVAMYVVMFGILYSIWQDVCGSRVENEGDANAFVA